MTCSFRNATLNLRYPGRRLSLSRVPWFLVEVGNGVSGDCAVLPVRPFSKKRVTLFRSWVLTSSRSTPPSRFSSQGLPGGSA
jgi:hypothetical protein